MDHLIKENCKIINQINFLTDSVALLQKLEDIKDKPLFHNLIEGVIESDNRIKIANKLLRRDLAIARKDYDTVMRELWEIQGDILNFLVKAKKRQISEAECLKTPIFLGASHSSVPRSVQKQVINSTLNRVQLKFEDMSVIPKISIKHFTPSPLVKSSKKMIAFDFEFNVRITPEQFDSIPKYMRGRVAFRELQYFLEHIVVPCFKEKYKLLYRTRAAVQNTKEFDLWKVFQSQITYAPGRHFITAGDIARKMDRMIDKRTQNLLIMIRHIGILQEQRTSQTICYIWTATF